MPMDIAIASAEMVPYAKVGGLADVVGALSKELSRMGHKVTVFLPRYSGIDGSRFPELSLKPAGEAPIRMGRKVEEAKYLVTVDPGTRVRLILVDHPGYFERENPYVDPATGEDWPDNLERFVFFNRAILESFRLLDWVPDVIHANDYQTGLIPVLLKEEYGQPLGAGLSAAESGAASRGVAAAGSQGSDLALGITSTLRRETSGLRRVDYRRIATLFSIHNMGYQGIFPEDSLSVIGLDPRLAVPTGPLEFWGKVNFMKAAIHYADLITTVSPRYAEEIQSGEEYGFGLEGVLRSRSRDLIGILNGIDPEIWDPANDQLIPVRYGPGDLRRKQENKVRLLESMELPVEPDVPLIGVISRLVDQKGFDLFEQIADEIFAERVKMVVLGSGQQKYEELMKRLRDRYPTKFAVALEFNNPLAHLIEAGSDFFLMPSRYEPCGLNQMYSLRYGTVPIVRATGGLADTVKDYNFRTGKGNGIVFEEYDASQLYFAIRRALRLYGKRRPWKKLVTQIMKTDHSWSSAADEYVRVYQLAIEKRRSA